ncbi:hypothetical protein F0L68_28385 [Solihabitans fulvus]|uniref:Uncharacterized protein n=1 Tax=Solihabitans fulvus TaxID=1892852 RepID=A0A5B2WX73_9PSEU|nr:hypothetical protein F0L68_28385 [Solihabitans fulvus]
MAGGTRERYPLPPTRVSTSTSIRRWSSTAARSGGPRCEPGTAMPRGAAAPTAAAPGAVAPGAARPRSGRRGGPATRTR